jgi:hypothetical protein
VGSEKIGPTHQRARKRGGYRVEEKGRESVGERERNPIDEREERRERGIELMGE